MYIIVLIDEVKVVDERLAWDGEKNEDDIFFTPLKKGNYKKKDCNVKTLRKIHLKMNGYVHFEIVTNSLN
jgi:hypothetical protein